MNATLSTPTVEVLGTRRRVAVVGTGIAGLMAAYRLHRDHDVHVYEAADYVGGHTNTVEVDAADGRHAIDTGFIVHNERTYPRLVALFRELGIACHDTTMSFSVRCDRSGTEYASNRLFADLRTSVSPSHLRMIAQILRWNRTAVREAAALGGELSLREFLRRGGYDQTFVDRFIVPMGAAIWSTEHEQMLSFPAAFFVRFLDNHGMLTPLDQPTWKTVVGGSQTYVRAMTRGFRDRIRLSTPVVSVRRSDDGVHVTDGTGVTERYDDVILAAHADQTLAMLADATDRERELLSALPYQRNEAVLHTDVSVLPRTRRAWASWNYRVPTRREDGVCVSYAMNILQGLKTRDTYVVSLNETAIDPSKVLRRITYHHPLFTEASTRAQARRGEICGQRGTHFAGAYWGYGFHEDGARSGAEVAERFAVRV